MKRGASSALQIAGGVVLGAIAQPFAYLGIAMFLQITSSNSWWPMSEFFAGLLYFGVVQAIVIVPLALAFWALGKNGVVCGLLYFGTFLAVDNVLAWVFRYRDFFLPKIY